MIYARLLRPLFAAVLLVSGAAAVTVSAGRDAPARAAETITRSVFSDEFNGATGTAPDAAKWVVPSGSGNAQLTGDGQLWLAAQLRAQKPLTQKSGRIEARIRMDRNGGVWRALGLREQDGGLPQGRVDVLGDDQVNGFDFHTYVIDWTAEEMVWSLDGRQVMRFTPEAGGEPLVVALNTGSGGQYGEVDMLLVDYVRVTTRTTVNATNWKTYTTYQPGKYVRFQGAVYRVRELHTSLPGWQPTLVPALFQKI